MKQPLFRMKVRGRRTLTARFHATEVLFHMVARLFRTSRPHIRTKLRVPRITSPAYLVITTDDDVENVTTLLSVSIFLV